MLRFYSLTKEQSQNGILVDHFGNPDQLDYNFLPKAPASEANCRHHQLVITDRSYTTLPKVNLGNFFLYLTFLLALSRYNKWLLQLKLIQLEPNETISKLPKPQKQNQIIRRRTCLNNYSFKFCKFFVYCC